MSLFNSDKIYNFMGNRIIFLSISVSMILLSFVLFFTKGVNFGVDFTGGTVIQIKYDKPAPIEKVRTLLRESPIFKSAFVSQFGSKEEIIIKASIANENINKDNGDLAREILKNTGSFEIRKVDVVGAKIGSELREKGLLALFLSLIVLLIYIGFRFEFRFAVASIIALLHDIVITVGIIILLQVDFNLDILAAILMILGYSINDTIVVFDRLREELKESSNTNLKTIINSSVTKTLSRTTLTSLTTLFVVLTLDLYGGEILHGFSLTLLTGIIIGTYSSIFIASSVLFTLNFDVKKFKNKELEKMKHIKEKERIRQMYESGVA